MIEKLRQWSKKMKVQLTTLYLVSKDGRTPWYVRFIIFFTIAYALSPIDLVPDFIPVLGILDDMILLPIGIYLAIRLTPKPILDDAHKQAAEYEWSPKKNWLGFTMVVLAWIIIILWVVHKFIFTPEEPV